MAPNTIPLINCWGDPADPYNIISGVPTYLTGVTQISAGSYFACALSPSSTPSITCWGASADYLKLNTLLRASPPSGVLQISCGYIHMCAITSNLSSPIICWGDDDHGQVSLPKTGLVGATQVSVGAFHSCALIPGSSPPYVCWGDKPQSTPTFQPGAVTMIIASYAVTCAATPGTYSLAPRNRNVHNGLGFGRPDFWYVQQW